MKENEYELTVKLRGNWERAWVALCRCKDVEILQARLDGVPLVPYGGVLAEPDASAPKSAPKKRTKPKAKRGS